MADKPIHLRPSKEAHTEASVTCPIWVTQSSLDGIAMLLSFFDGVEKAGGGSISGSFDLLMFYRTLRSNIGDHYKREDALGLTPKEGTDGQV